MADRPKLEIVRTEDAVSIWLGGKELVDYVGAHTKLDAVEETAQLIAAALGAEVEHTDDPSRQPYRYFVTYVVNETGMRGLFSAGAAIHGSKWFDLPGAIDGPDDLVPLVADITKTFTEDGGTVRVAITGFTCIDGPF